MIVIMIIPATSIQNPAINISEARNFLLPKTMVFGAVAIGSINPSDAASVAGIIRISGSIPVSF